jgi:hypothetical protein
VTTAISLPFFSVSIDPKGLEALQGDEIFSGWGCAAILFGTTVRPLTVIFTSAGKSSFLEAHAVSFYTASPEIPSPYRWQAPGLSQPHLAYAWLAGQRSVR